MSIFIRHHVNSVQTYKTVRYEDGHYWFSGDNVDIIKAAPGIYGITWPETGTVIKTKKNEIYVSIYNGDYEGTIKINKLLHSLIKSKIPYEEILNMINL